MTDIDDVLFVHLEEAHHPVPHFLNKYGWNSDWTLPARGSFIHANNWSYRICWYNAVGQWRAGWYLETTDEVVAINFAPTPHPPLTGWEPQLEEAAHLVILISATQPSSPGAQPLQIQRFASTQAGRPRGWPYAADFSGFETFDFCTEHRMRTVIIYDEKKTASLRPDGGDWPRLLQRTGTLLEGFWRVTQNTIVVVYANRAGALESERFFNSNVNAKQCFMFTPDIIAPLRLMHTKVRASLLYIGDGIRSEGRAATVPGPIVPGPARTREGLCREWVHGECIRGAGCTLGHGRNKRTAKLTGQQGLNKIPHCIHYVQGRCFVNACPMRHDGDRKRNGFDPGRAEDNEWIFVKRFPKGNVRAVGELLSSFGQIVELLPINNFLRIKCESGEMAQAIVDAAKIQSLSVDNTQALEVTPYYVDRLPPSRASNGKGKTKGRTGKAGNQ